jgi:ribosome-binding factor A
MKTIKLNLYTFKELSKEAQEKAIEDNRYFNVDHEWWNCTYDDMENIGATIKSFDIDRREIEIVLNKPIDEIVNTILTEHGKECQTYITAKCFEKQVRERVMKGLEQKEGTIRMFKDSIGLQYINMLQKEYEYLTSEECIQDSLIVNEYDFTESGKIY